VRNPQLESELLSASFEFACHPYNFLVFFVKPLKPRHSKGNLVQQPHTTPRRSKMYSIPTKRMSLVKGEATSRWACEKSHPKQFWKSWKTF
jgi:hypothetical protein